MDLEHWDTSSLVNSKLHYYFILLFSAVSPFLAGSSSYSNSLSNSAFSDVRIDPPRHHMMLTRTQFHFMFSITRLPSSSQKIVLWILYHRNEKPKFRCSVAILNTQGAVAMETELHWPEMKASEDLDFHCTWIFNHRLFLHQPFHQVAITTTAPWCRDVFGINK